MSVIGIVSHFTTQRGNRLNSVFAIQEIQSSQTGNALAEILVKLIKE